MTNEYVYHAVTEKPMETGQIITFDQNHYNGVYQRVMTCKALLDGKDPTTEMEKFIHSNLSYWTVRTYRELALEKVRVERYPDYPSRMACLYTTKNLTDAEMWADSFLQSGREVFQIVMLRTDGKVFNGDAYNVFDGTTNEEANTKNADYYWSNQPNSLGKEALVETLIDGNIEVVEVVKEL